MSKRKNEYLIALINADGTYCYVTSIDNAKKEFCCAPGKQALTTTVKSKAENWHYNMLCEGLPAVMITAPANQHIFENKAI